MTHAPHAAAPGMPDAPRLEAAHPHTPRARAKTASAGQRQGGSRLRTTGIAVLSFLAGVAFWHVVGFWSFVSEIVFDRKTSSPSVAGRGGAGFTTPDGTPMLASGKPATTLLGAVPAGTIASSLAGCASIRLHRAAGRTSQDACPPSLADAADRMASPDPARRTDYAPRRSAPVPAVAGWTARRDVPEAAEDAAVSGAPYLRDGE